MIKCKTAIKENGDLAVEAVDCKLSMTQILFANFVILEAGEYVCRDVTCKMCLGKKKYYNQYADREFKCNICNGTGIVPERVG